LKTTGQVNVALLKKLKYVCFVAMPPTLRLFMIRTHDDLIRIEVVKNIGNITPVVADFSIIDLPANAEEARSLLSSIYNNPSLRHISLILNRNKKKDKIDSLTNLTIAHKVGFEYLDTVSIWYEKPSTCSNNGFLPVAETGYIFYKGVMPDVKTTAWFSEDKSNATNLWNVSPQPKEPKQVTYYQKFSWEIPLLLLSMSEPLEHRRFIYISDLSEAEHESLFMFCKTHNIGVQLYSTSDSAALHLIRSYNTDYTTKKNK
jgi:hypothetical protein